MLVIVTGAVERFQIVNDRVLLLPIRIDPKSIALGVTANREVCHGKRNARYVQVVWDTSPSASATEPSACTSVTLGSAPVPPHPIIVPPLSRRCTFPMKGVNVSGVLRN